MKVVVTNQMTTVVGGDRASQQVPALGESWAHVATQRVILYWQQQQRHAVLYKSPSNKQTDVRFQITVSIHRCCHHINMIHTRPAKSQNLTFTFFKPRNLRKQV